MGALRLTYHNSNLIASSSLELTNHLGNVLSVISDKVIPHPSGGSIAYYKADILQSQDYSPFGVTLKGRNLKKTGLADEFRFGFNGMEADDEMKGDGNSYDFGARMLDPRLGRFLSLDAFTKNFAPLSPYTFANNIPTSATDVNGDSAIVLIWRSEFGANGYGFGHAGIAIQNYKTVEMSISFGAYVHNYQIRVPDGTYTYYDLWPIAEEGVQPTLESAMKNYPAQYNTFKKMGDGTIITKDQLLNGDPSRGEDGRKADGVIEMYTSREEDGTLKAKLSKLRGDEKNYNGISYNCTDYVSEAIKRIYKDKLNESSFGKEEFSSYDFSAPNEFFQDLKSLASMNKCGKLLREVGDFDVPFVNEHLTKTLGYSGTSVPVEQSKK